jgi:tetratricopeptide (TPR) repeat protein
MSRRVVPLLVLLVAIVAGPRGARSEDEDSLPVLRRHLMFAQGRDQTGRALDALATRIGKDPAFPDHGAFGDWLGDLPSGKSLDPLVQLRRGWAYVTAKRGPDAIAPLEAALKDDPASGLTRAYLGEALRQSGRCVEALDMLALAIGSGETGRHVVESAIEAALALRRDQGKPSGEGLPPYANGLRAVIDALSYDSRAELDATLAQWLLADLVAYERPDTSRGRLWATTAGEHALAAIRGAAEPQAGSARMAYEAAVAMTAADADARGRTIRFDLLAEAVRVGDRLSGDDPHPVPQVFVLLAEAAAAEGRYALAYRMAKRRMQISWSPRARRVLDRLPPDLGADE